MPEAWSRRSALAAAITRPFRPLHPRCAAIVPPASVAGRSLSLVIAIMTYLACLTIGAVSMMARTAESWQSSIASEITIQIRPADGIDAGAEAERAARLARETSGIAGARLVSQEESAALLEPWLGAGLDLSALPVPRLVMVEVASGSRADLAGLRQRLEAVPGASLDDHKLWQDKLATMTRTLIALCLSILALVLAATVLTVVFATRGTMSSNREIVEVLDLVGASQGFIAGEFQRHFLLLGLKGALYGGAFAMATFLAAQWLFARSRWTPAADQIEALFGTLSIGWPGYGGAAATVLLVAGLTAVTSRAAVMAALRHGE